jgi:hypothetical protein
MSQWVKGRHQSGSRIGQYQHDHLPNTFTAVDVDNVVYKRSTNILRVFEEKLSHESMKPAQLELLQKVARMVKHEVLVRHLAVGSGVWLLQWEDDDTNAPAGHESRLSVFAVPSEGKPVLIYENERLVDLVWFIAGEVAEYS